MNKNYYENLYTELSKREGKDFAEYIQKNYTESQMTEYGDWVKFEDFEFTTPLGDLQGVKESDFSLYKNLGMISDDLYNFLVDAQERLAQDPTPEAESEMNLLLQEVGDAFWQHEDIAMAHIYTENRDDFMKALEEFIDNLDEE